MMTLVFDAAPLIAWWQGPPDPAAPRTRLFAAVEAGRATAVLSAATLAAVPVPWLRRGEYAIGAVVDRFLAEFPHLTVVPVTPRTARIAAAWLAAGVPEGPLLWAVATAEEIGAAGVVVDAVPVWPARGVRCALPQDWLAALEGGIAGGA